MSFEPKGEQASAITTLDRHVSVTAGPGAGKTFVLVERYLEILRRNSQLNIDQIVAITFTNRAANEMRERLRKRLDQILATESGDSRRRWMHYKRTLDGAVITTIHGFCSRLLREFPVEARIDPQFVTLDEHQASALLENAVEESLTEFINRGHDAVSRLTAGVGRGRLAAALVELYRNVRGQGLDVNQLGSFAEKSHARWTDYQLLVNQVDELANQFISTRGLTPKADEKRAEMQRRWPKVVSLLRDESTPLADYCREIVELREAARPSATGPIGSIIRELDELFWHEKKDKAYGRMPSLRFDLVAREYACEALKVLASIDERLEETKRQLSALDYDDLQVRALQLLSQPEVLLRASRRYQFFLVDEFQDTNPIQRDLLERLVLGRTDANLFIVGDPKQSIYGFRGADVGVFGEMSSRLVASGGTEVPLRLNFRSQPPLIDFCNLLFARLFQPDEEIARDELSQLGFVSHEASVAERQSEGDGPHVELLIDTLVNELDEQKEWRDSRQRDAMQVARRIQQLVGKTDLATDRSAKVSPDRSAGVSPAIAENLTQPGGRDARAPNEPDDARDQIGGQGVAVTYGDIALLFRAMTNVPTYEAVFRRLNIPYQTVLGKGFYDQEEITDLIQLLRFLDNRTDELALAAVLRSPLVGISDNTLLALRLAPLIGETPEGERPQARRRPRKLFRALRQQSEIDFIADEEREALDRSLQLLRSLIEKRNRYPVGDLLRFAVRQSEYMTIIAASFDGAQRLANVEKLFSLAERFARSGAHLIRDFVKYVRDFEAIGSRESEGQLDEAANAVTLMTIHQAKGLEFPVVIVPDLQRFSSPKDNWFLLDRHLGLTLKVPDGRGGQVSGGTFKIFSERARLREQFENQRLLYVAATRAEDRLILSAAIDQLSKIDVGRECWLKLIWQALALAGSHESGVVNLDPDVQIQFRLNLADEPDSHIAGEGLVQKTVDEEAAASADSPAEMFPLLDKVTPPTDVRATRFSVTQLINYRRCPRQYYFDRVLHLPAADEVGVWNNAEAPEPPANLNATLRGAVIHRFCEMYVSGEDPSIRLLTSFNEVIRTRQSQLADRLIEIDAEAAMAELLPLAQNYLASNLYARVEKARTAMSDGESRTPIGAELRSEPGGAGLWSELSFRLQQPAGLITGTIDKLLITRAENGKDWEIEIVDFKTNRFRRPAQNEVASPIHAEVMKTAANGKKTRSSAGQFSFDFEQADPQSKQTISADEVGEQVKLAAQDYQLQMQAYALAVRQLLPESLATARVKVTLHFLQPDVEFHLPEELLEPEVCAAALDRAMRAIVSSAEPSDFPILPALHCRMCNFIDVCPGGRAWLSKRLSG